MISVQIKKGYRTKIAGGPSPEVEPLEKPAQVALLPEKIPFVKPRLKVKIGDKVKVGTPVFEDKRNSNLTFFIAGRG